MTELLDCGHVASEHGPHTTGYGTDKDDKRHCYDCCAARERASMIEHGDAVLYLTGGLPAVYQFCDGEITDWPGKLRFKCRVKAGRHNMARVRYDAWFTGPDGKPWHGVQYGNNTQIIHCKRVKG
jgi:hypothetical protein